MFGIPLYVLAIIVVVIVAAVGVAAYLAFRWRLSFKRFFGVNPTSGAEETVRSVVRQVLRRMMWELETLEGLLDFYKNRAAQAIDTDTALGVHSHADVTRREILGQRGDLSAAAVVSSHFDHTDVIKELGLEHCLSEKVSTRV